MYSKAFIFHVCSTCVYSENGALFFFLNKQTKKITCRDFGVIYKLLYALVKNKSHSQKNAVDWSETVIFRKPDAPKSRGL